MDCPFAKNVWKIQMGKEFLLTRRGDFINWVHHQFPLLGKEEQKVFCFVIWAVWHRRNRKCFEGISAEPEESCAFIANFMKELKETKRKVDKPVNCPNEKKNWEKPPTGFCKANCDGAWAKSGNRAAVGVLIRDHQGSVVAVFAQRVTGARSAREVEAIALIEALKLGKLIGLRKLVVEGDAKLVLEEAQMMLDGKMVEDLSPVRETLEEAVELSGAFENLTLAFGGRERNRAAHKCAQIALNSEEELLWLGQEPTWLSDILLEERCNNPLLN